MSLEKLPYEVVNNIYQRVGRKGCGSHLTVSKKWYSMTKLIFYQEIRLDGSRFGWLLQQLFSKDGGLVEFSLFSNTKKLTIRDTRYKVEVLAACFKAEEIAILFSQFENLKALDISHCAYEGILMNVILNNDSCNPKLFPQLEEVITKNFMQAYLPLYSKYCHTIKNAIFGGHVSQVQAGSFLKILPTLRNLKRITVRSRAGQYPPSLFDLIQARPDITFIDMDCIGSYINDTYISEKPFNSYVEDHKLSFDNLKILNLSQHHLGPRYVNFFTNFRLENLEEVNIETGVEFARWVDALSLGKALQLAKHLGGKLKSFTLKTQEYAGFQCSKGYSKGGIRRVDQFYQVLNALRGNREVSSCTAYFTNYKPEDSASMEMSITNSNCISYKYFISRFDYLKLAPKNLSYCGDDYKHTTDFTHPPTSSFSEMSGPQGINHLNLYYLKNHKFLANDIYKKCLDYADDEKFSQLNTFNMGYESTRSDHGEYPEYNTKSFVPTTLAAKQENNQRSFLKDMVSIYTAGLNYSQEWIDILNQYFPKMKVLHYDFIIETAENGFAPTDIKLTSFLNLRTFCIQIHKFSRRFYASHVYFELSHKDAHYQSCFKLDQYKHSLQPVSVDVYEGQKHRPLSFQYVFNIECLPQLQIIEANNQTLFDLGAAGLSGDDVIQSTVVLFFLGF